MAERFELHPNQISQWEQEFIEKSKDVFDKKSNKAQEKEVDLDQLYAKIGRLEVERDYLKKKLEETQSTQMKKELILNKTDKTLSIRKQCELMNIGRSTLYYKPIGERPKNLEMMRLMDEHILDEPTAGVFTMQSMLLEKDIKAGYERVRRLMRKANIRPIYPRRHLTVLGEKKYVYPYLLKNLKIDHANQV